MKKQLIAAFAASIMATGSLAGYAGDLYEVDSSPFHTFIARKSGDLVTIVIWERVETRDNAVVMNERKNNADFTLKDIFFPHVNISDGLTKLKGSGDSPVVEWSANNKFNATANNTADHLFKTTIEARLVEEVVDGQFVIRGHRYVNINGKQKKIFVSGVVRQRDITPYNTIDSDKIVDAVVEIEGEVAQEDAQPGFLMKAMQFLF